MTGCHSIQLITLSLLNLRSVKDWYSCKRHTYGHFSFLSCTTFYDAPKQDAIVKTLIVEPFLTLRCVPEFDPVIQSSSERALQSSTNRSMMRFCCRLISNLTHTQAKRKRKGTSTISAGEWLILPGVDFLQEGGHFFSLHQSPSLRVTECLWLILHHCIARHTPRTKM